VPATCLACARERWRRPSFCDARPTYASARTLARSGKALAGMTTDGRDCRPATSLCGATSHARRERSLAHAARRATTHAGKHTRARAKARGVPYRGEGGAAARPYTFPPFSPEIVFRPISPINSLWSVVFPFSSPSLARSLLCFPLGRLRRWLTHILEQHASEGPESLFMCHVWIGFESHRPSLHLPTVSRVWYAIAR